MKKEMQYHINEQCRIHKIMYTLIGNDKQCKQNCLICTKCVQDIKNQAHKKENILHNTLKIEFVEDFFQSLIKKNEKQMKQSKQKIDKYFNDIITNFQKQLETSKLKQYQLVQSLMLTSITKHPEKLKIIENLYFQRFHEITCSDIALVAKKFNGKIESTLEGNTLLNKYIDEQKKTIDQKINNLLLNNQKYDQAILDDSKEVIDYPLFKKKRPITPETPPPSPPKKPKKVSPPKPLPKPNIGLGTKKVQFENSKVLTKQQDRILITFLPKPAKYVQLLYRASQNQFSTSKFHQFCDNQTNTLVILKTEFGKVIGGYTPVPWKSTAGTMHADVSKQSFLFSLSLKQKFELKDEKSAIFNYSEYGPCFGGGSDLAILNNSYKQQTSYSQFPYSYNNAYNLTNNQQTTSFFTGQTNGKFFCILQWQVWKIKI